MSYFVSPDLSYDALMRLMSRVDKRDLESIQRASLLYDNNTEPLKTPAMNASDLDSRRRCWVPVALTSVIVDKIATALYGRDVRRTTGNDALDSIFNPTWNDMSRVMLRVSKVASLAKNDTIGVAIRYPGIVKYMDYGAGNVIPLLDPEDPHGRPIGLIFEYFTDTRDVSSQISTYLRGGEKTIKHVVEITTRHQRGPDGSIVLPGIHLLFEDGKKVMLGDNGYNVLGDFLGSVFWRGADHPDDATGRSDVIPLIQTLDGLNDLLCTANEKILWNVHSPIVTNIRVEADRLRYGPGEMWAVTGGGTGEFFKRLESDADISPIMELVYSLITMVHETARVPSVATGDLEHIGNLSSGRAFEIAMTPLNDLMKEKEAIASSQELELIYESVAYMAYYGYLSGLAKPSVYGDWAEPDTEKIAKLLENASVSFEPMTYPADDKVPSIVTAVEKKLMSIKQGVTEIHPDWTDTQIEDEIALISEPTTDLPV